MRVQLWTETFCLLYFKLHRFEVCGCRKRYHGSSTGLTPSLQLHRFNWLQCSPNAASIVRLADVRGGISNAPSVAAQPGSAAEGQAAAGGPQCCCGLQMNSKWSLTWLFH
jgi:hypothetical protein